MQKDCILLPAERIALIDSLIKAAEYVVKAKKDAEDDPLYALNEGIHTSSIDHAFQVLERTIAKVKGE